MFLYSAIFVLTLLKGYEGYGLGPPITACWDMFPAGHEVSSQPSHTAEHAPPFSFTLNATSYSPNDVIKVFLDSAGEWFMEGVLIQVRRVNDNVSPPAVGTFELKEGGDIFLKTMDCFEMTGSSLQHYSHMHIYNRTFYWKAPSVAVGDVVLRATIARNRTLFWTDVRSEVIQQEGTIWCDTSAAMGNTAQSTTTIILLITSVIFTFLLNCRVNKLDF